MIDIIGYTAQASMVAWAATTTWGLLRARPVPLPTVCCGLLCSAALTGSGQSVALWLEAVAEQSSVLATQLAWVGALGLLSRWLLGRYYGATRPPWAPALEGALAMWVIVLVLAWLSHEPAVELVAFGLAMSLFGGACAVLAAAAVPLLRGRHQHGRLAVAIGSVFATEFGLLDVTASLRALNWPDTLPTLAPPTVLAHLALLLISMGGVLPALPFRNRHADPHEPAALEQLWSWLAPDRPAIAIDDQSPTGLWTSDAVIQIHDRIWYLQRWVLPWAVGAAQGAAHRYGLPRRDARTAAVAECLWRAIQAQTQGVPPYDRPARLVGLGGGRWTADEQAWLLSLHAALSRIPAGPARRQTPGPVMPSPLADPELDQHCRARIVDYLPSPRPASLAGIRDAIARRRGRPIYTMLSEHLSGGPGIYVALPDCDLIMINSWLSPWMQMVVEAHELGHLVCEHRPVQLDLSKTEERQALDRVLAAAPELPADLVLSIRARCLCGEIDWDHDPIERAAEKTGRLLIEHLVQAPAAGVAQLVACSPPA